MLTNNLHKSNLLSYIFSYFGIAILLFSLFIKIKFLPIFGITIFFIGILIYSHNRLESKKMFFNFNFVYKIEALTFIIGSIPFIIFFLNWFGFELYSNLFFAIFSISILLSTLLLFRKKTISEKYKEKAVFFNPFKNSSIYAVIMAVFIFIFYIELYWYPKNLENVVKLFNPLSNFLRGKDSDQWFLYGTIYSLCVIFWGIKFINKYRKKTYQKWKTLSLIFSQVVFSYFIPTILESFRYNSSSDLSGKYLGYYSANPANTWPLNYDFFSPSHLEAYTQKAYQPIGQAFFIWGLFIFIILTPILTYFVGKRWYCSWICSCGGLAETIGDSFRHLSDKSKKSWKIERVVIHSVLLFVSIMTISVLFSYFSGKEFNLLWWSINKTYFFIIILSFLLLFLFLTYFFYKRSNRTIFLIIIGIIFTFIILLSIAYITGNNNVFVLRSSTLKKSYGFLIGAIFSGILGVGFYPILGSRFWCRFGCPMAAYMGIFQRFHSRFQITVNKNQCISCGNCTVYCEQGIDVRSYAQNGIDIKRSSCVGCGICATVCPRGVLKLENVKKEKQ